MGRGAVGGAVAFLAAVATIVSGGIDWSTWKSEPKPQNKTMLMA